MIGLCLLEQQRWQKTQKKVASAKRQHMKKGPRCLHYATQRLSVSFSGCCSTDPWQTVAGSPSECGRDGRRCCVLSTRTVHSVVRRTFLAASTGDLQVKAFRCRAPRIPTVTCGVKSTSLSSSMDSARLSMCCKGSMDLDTYADVTTSAYDLLCFLSFFFDSRHCAAVWFEHVCALSKDHQMKTLRSTLGGFCQYPSNPSEVGALFSASSDKLLRVAVPGQLRVSLHAWRLPRRFKNASDSCRKPFAE